MARSAIGMLLVGALLSAGLLLAGESHAAPESDAAPRPRVTFALIVGVNTSLDDDLPTLRYADDDAANTFELFRALGARTYLLAAPDESTRRLHPQASAEAVPPSRAALRYVVSAVAADVGRARAQGFDPVLYLYYAGHGTERDGQARLALQDGWWTADQIVEQVVDPVAAARTHLLVDACYGYWLAYTRGPGGETFEVTPDFAEGVLLRRKDLGLVLAASTGDDTHEWAGYQAGVFSHLLRSAMYGAADVDLDGQVSYREVQAFIHQATLPLNNEKFRPRVLARAPAGEPILVNLETGLERRLEVDPPQRGHFLLETDEGVRVLDFHNAAGQSLRLVRGGRPRPLYLRPVGGREEYVVPSGLPVVRLAQLDLGEPDVARRGGAARAFRHMFREPFGLATLQAFVPPPLPTPQVPAARQRLGSRLRSYVTYSAFAAAGVTAVAGAAFSLAAWSAYRDVSVTDSQTSRLQTNNRITARSRTATVLYAGAGVAAVAGVVAMLWPERVARAPGDLPAQPQGSIVDWIGPAAALSGPPAGRRPRSPWPQGVVARDPEPAALALRWEY